MNLPTFLGGVHPPEGKALTENKAIEILRPEDTREFIYPLSQHIGAPCSPVVAKGDRVLAGQKIADTEAFVSAVLYLLCVINRALFGNAIVVRSLLHAGGLKPNQYI